MATESFLIMSSDCINNPLRGVASDDCAHSQSGKVSAGKWWSWLCWCFIVWGKPSIRPWTHHLLSSIPHSIHQLLMVSDWQVLCISTPLHAFSLGWSALPSPSVNPQSVVKVPSFEVFEYPVLTFLLPHRAHCSCSWVFITLYKLLLLCNGFFFVPSPTLFSSQSLLYLICGCNHCKPVSACWLKPWKHLGMICKVFSKINW